MVRIFLWRVFTFPYIPAIIYCTERLAGAIDVLDVGVEMVR